MGKRLFSVVNPILIVLIVGLAFAVGILYQKVSDFEKGVSKDPAVAGQVAGQPQPTPNPEGKLSSDQAKNIPEVSDKDHIKGSRDAEVFLIEYSDFECTFCSRFHFTAQKAIDEYGDQMAWIYRHFPLDSIHPNARPAALASECAAEAGGEEAFWAFTDALFEDSSKLDNLSSVATEIGLNTQVFDACLDAAIYADEVESDYQSGLSAGVTGTPGNFVVNSAGEAWILPGAVPYESLKQTIDKALEAF